MSLRLTLLNTGRNTARKTYLKKGSITTTNNRVSHRGGASSLIWGFFLNPTSWKLVCPTAHSPPLENEVPLNWKTRPPPSHWNVKHPSMKWFLEKAQIVTENLAKILQKYVWRSSFLVNLQVCWLIAGNFIIKWIPSQAFFDSILSPLPCFPHVLT